jgi:O-antigen ligase
MQPGRVKLQQYYYWSLCILAFVIPLPFIFGSLAVILVTILWVFTGGFKEKLDQLWQRKIYWLWIAYFLLHVISYTYARDKPQSAFDIETKLCFWLLPLVVGTGPILERKHLSKILGAFVTSFTLVALFCFAQAFYSYQSSGDSSVFFYHKLVTGFEANAVYFAWYVLFSLAVLMLYEWESTSWYTKKPLLVTSIAIQFTFLVFLSSRTLLLLFLVLVLPLFFRRIYSRISSIQRAILISIPLIAVLVIILTNNPIRQRFSDVVGSKPSLKEQTTDGYLHLNNLTLRLLIWETALENMKEKNLWLTGCSNGDVAALQKERMARDKRISPYDFHEVHIWRFNLHNMYLQSLYMLGSAGLLIFLLIMLTPLPLIWQMNDRWLFLVFHFSSLLFMMQESALQTQAGIIYFTFFSILIIRFYHSTVKSGTPTVKRREIME